MSKDWTINTCVLYRVADLDCDAIEFLNRVQRERHRVTFDHERHIEREYQKCLERVQRERKPGREVLKKLVRTVIGRMAVKFSGRLQNRHQQALRKLRFHVRDWPFVGVCLKTADKKLVSEDSDYTDEVKCYLKSKMEVDVLSILDSLTI